MENIKPVKSERQYQLYLKEIDKLMDKDPSPSTKEGQRLELMTILVEDYEKRQGWEIPLPDDPIEVIKIRMENLDLKQADLAEVIGDKTVISRILNRSRKLTYSMVRPLSELLRVPPEFLLEKN